MVHLLFPSVSSLDSLLVFWRFHYWKNSGNKKIKLLLLNLSSLSNLATSLNLSIFSSSSGLQFQIWRKFPGLDNPHGGVSISNPMIRVPRPLFSLNSKGRLPFFFFLLLYSAFCCHILMFSRFFTVFFKLGVRS